MQCRRYRPHLENRHWRRPGHPCGDRHRGVVGLAGPDPDRNRLVPLLSAVSAAGHQQLRYPGSLIPLPLLADAGASPPITSVQASGAYTLDAYELAGSGAKALKILKSVDPVTGQRTWYYVQARQAIGGGRHVEQRLGAHGEGHVQVDPLRHRQPFGLALQPFQRLDPPRRLGLQLEPLDQPVAVGLAADVVEPHHHSCWQYLRSHRHKFDKRHAQ